MSMKERLHTGELYLPDDPEIVSLQQECLERLYEYNATRPHESEKRAALLQEMFAQIGEGCYIEPPLRSNWGGYHVVGAGSIVTKDLPSSVVAVGNPCHVLRPIGAHDREYYFREHRIDPSFLDYSDAAESPVQ